MPALPLSHYSKIKCGAYLIPTAFLFSCKIIHLITPDKQGHTYHCENRLIFVINMVNMFDMKITMSNGIFEQTSNLMMAFLRYLIAILSRHLTDRWHFSVVVTSNGKTD